MSCGNWWFDAFPLVPYEKAPPGQSEMLTLVAYDISEPKRLVKVARVCEDFGVRVQYSIFECRLDEAEFTEFWLSLPKLTMRRTASSPIRLTPVAPKKPSPPAGWSA